MNPSTDSAIVARDATYSRRSYRSFEFVTFDAAAGGARVLLTCAHAPARDLLLAVAGLVTPTSGSLSVCGVELARSGGASARRRLPRGLVGFGVFERIAEVPEHLTVEEAVAKEAAMRRCGLRSDVDVLPFLAELGLATAAEQRIAFLEPAGRARLSAALALVGAPRVAVVDLTDPFASGLTSGDAAALVRDAVSCAEGSGTALLVATTELACALEVPSTALDIPSAEALDAARSATRCGREVRA